MPIDIEPTKSHTMIIVTDTYQQTNGVSTTYKNLEKVALKRGRAVKILHPGLYNWVPMPFYPEIQLAIQPVKFWQTLSKLNPEKIHIATEGSLGLVARIWCRLNKKTFTTSYHTKFPEYLKVMFGVPLRFTYWYLRLFHSKAKATFIATPSVKNELVSKGFKNLVVWTRGVDSELIYPDIARSPAKKIRTLYVGRVSKEKNLDALCALENEFDISIVGNGPYFDELQSKYKNVKFLGYQFGQALAKIYAEHDVFAFPSHTDTFGIVMIEAMCNGLPVAAYNVAGPRDVVENAITGVLGDDLRQSIIACQALNRADIKTKSIQKWSWDNCFDTFTQHLDAKNA